MFITNANDTNATPDDAHQIKAALAQHAYVC